MEEHGSSIDVAQRWVEAMDDSDLDSVMPLYDARAPFTSSAVPSPVEPAFVSTFDRRRPARSCSWRSRGTTGPTSGGGEGTMSRWRPHSVSQEAQIAEQWLSSAWGG